jgi:hypothetical protein
MAREKTEHFLDDNLFLPELQVHEAAALPSGILDRHGRMLVRPKERIGFKLGREK